MLNLAGIGSGRMILSLSGVILLVTNRTETGRHTPMIKDTDALGWDECQRLVEWFTHRMSQETRHELMADLPQLYGKLYPTVDPAVITAAVHGKLNRIAVERRDMIRAKLDLAERSGAAVAK